MKTVGIIGGFGPETTAKFQLDIVDLFQARGSTRRPSMIMWNAPIPLKIEENLVLHEKDSEKFILFLKQGARILEKAGADFLVLPCNTLHIFIREIKKSVSIPVLSLLDAVSHHVKSRHIAQIMVLGTQMTISSALYTQTLINAGLSVFTPDTREQNIINKAIFCILQQNDIQKARQLLNSISAQKCKDILLACTDLQLAFQNKPEFTVHDTMHILAEATVEELLK